MRTPPPALLPLFRSETQLSVLGRLFAGSEVEVQVVDLASSAGVSAPTASRELSRLERAGLVRSRTLGRSRLYQANWELPWAAELASILAQTVGVLGALGAALAHVDGVAAAFVFGSWAARHAGEPGRWPGDVDVAVIGAPDALALMRAARSIENDLRVQINTVVFDAASWASPAPDSLAASLHARPLVPVALEAA